LQTLSKSKLLAESKELKLDNPLIDIVYESFSPIPLNCTDNNGESFQIQCFKHLSMIKDCLNNSNNFHCLKTSIKHFKILSELSIKVEA